MVEVRHQSYERRLLREPVRDSRRITGDAVARPLFFGLERKVFANRKGTG